MGTLSRPYTFISLAHEPWSDVWLNRQHIMSRLASAHRVLHFPRIPRWRELVWKLKLHEPIEWRSRRLTPTLRELRPVPWLPRVREWPDLDRFLQKLQAARIRSSLRRRGWDNRIVYIWHPEMGDMAGRFGERLVCFHVYDDYTHYTWLRPEARREVEAQMHRLLARADLVFAAGEAMRTALPRDDVIVVPNGVDYELFATAHDVHEPPPSDMAHIPHPIVGHIGRLQMGVDIALLAEIARRRRDWSVLLLGPVPGRLPPEQQAALDLFRAQPNAYYIPGKPVAELPRYLRHVDVPVMAYKMAGWIKTAFPLKLFEYLAAGKPCVGSPLDENVRYGEYITVASTLDEWIGAIEHWLANDSEALAAKRMTLAKANSWDVRCRQILRAIAAKLGDPPPEEESER